MGCMGKWWRLFFYEKMKDVRGPFAPRTTRRNVGDPGVLGRVAWRAQCCGGRWPNSCCVKGKTMEDQGVGQSETMNTDSAA